MAASSENAQPGSPAVGSPSDAALSTGKRQAPDDKDADAASSETVAESPRPAAKRRTMCGVCNAEVGRYKCPRCPLAYCSVTCSRTHRDNHPPVPDDKPKPASAPAPADSPTTHKHPFSVLDDSAELKRLFAKYPRLPTRLRQILEATQPPPMSAPARKFHLDDGDPPPPRDQPWTAEMGLRQGRKALRRARVDPSEDGDAVREYCELVVYLLSGRAGSDPSTANNATGGDAAMAMVKQEVLQGDLSAIRGLLESEGGR